VVVSSDHFGNLPSFSTRTAEPNVQVNTFVNEAIGFKSNFEGFNNSSSMKYVGFDAAWKIQPANGGNGVGFRYTFPRSTAAQTFERGLWVAAPSGGTNITTGTAVYVEDLASQTGITNRYSFFGVGATDTAHFGGPAELLGPFTFTSDNTTDIGAAGATRPRTGYFGTSVVTPLVSTTGATGGFSGTEGTGAGVPASGGLDVMWPDSTAHRWKMNNNNGGAQNILGSSDFTTQDCGSTSTCANTAKSPWIMVRGSVAFPTATTVTVTSLPFSSASSYSCMAGDATTAAGVVNATTYTSGSSVTFTETGGVNTDTARYMCIGF
jgi:hypothetical protein